MNKPWWQSSTIWGAIAVAAFHGVPAFIAAPSLAEKGRAVGEAIGIVTAAFGARTAIAKNGTGQ